VLRQGEGGGRTLADLISIGGTGRWPMLGRDSQQEEQRGRDHHQGDGRDEPPIVERRRAPGRGDGFEDSSQHPDRRGREVDSEDRGRRDRRVPGPAQDRVRVRGLTLGRHRVALVDPGGGEAAT